MVNEYKRIVLLKGLTPISDDHFSLFKSLIASDLGLNRNKQKQCTRVQIADMMEDKFPDDAGLGKLIKFCEDLSGLRKRARILKKERSKVIGEASLEINRQEAGPAMPTPTTSHMLKSERGETSTAHAETSIAHAEISAAHAETSTACAETSTAQAQTSTAQAKTSTAQKRKRMSKEKTGVKKTKASKGPDQPPCSEEDTARWQSSIPQVSSSTSSNISLAKKALEAHLNLKMSPGSSTSPSQNFPVFPASDASIHLNSNVPSTLFSAAQVPHVPSATAFSNVGVPFMPSETVFCSPNALQMSPITVSSSIHDVHVPTPAAFHSTQAPHSQATTSTNVQTTKKPLATLKKKAQLKMPPPATASSSLLAPQLSSATTSRALHAIPGSTATYHSNPSGTPRRGTVPKGPSEEVGHHQGPKQVMVLKVTEPFTYDTEEDKRMFHATVATETEFFRVKVFDTALKSKFIPRKIIAISDYFGCNGFLEIYRHSCVSDVNVDQTMVISNKLRERAIETPKISHIFLQTKGTFVNGEFAVIKKTERNKFIYYGIEDDTGKMEVVVYGRLTNINCEPGSKLILVCFELTSSEDMWQLRCVRHSYMQVINARR